MMHIMKVILFLGLCYGLRGGKEIAFLTKSNIVIATFPPGHPLAGKKYVEINPINCKKEKLSIYNSVMKKHHLRLPVLPCADTNGHDPGSCILRFTKRFHPDQE